MASSEYAPDSLLHDYNKERGMVSQATGTNLETSGIGDPDFRQLGEFVVATMERLHVPGVAVGVLHDGVEHVAGFGITSVEAPVPAHPNTLFQIGSTHKTLHRPPPVRAGGGGGARP